MKSNRFIPVAIACCLVSVMAFGQAQTTGALTGTVTSSGAPLPGATVTATSPNLQGSRTAYTDTNGNYNFAALPPGDYTVRVELQGLQTVTQTVKVGVTQTARADADLKVSGVVEAITVTASAPAVLETTEVQTNLTARFVENLPVGRTLLATTNLAPGVTTNGPGGNTMISGGQSFDNTFYVDGAVVNELLRGQPQNLFIEDALQETTVQTGAISAEFGRFTGGVVTAISKSGGNNFTGSVRDTITNPSWTARGELNTTDSTDSMFHNYEATLGGRIIRDRLWFFTAGRYNSLDYERRFFRTPTDTQIYSFPYNDKERRIEAKLTGQITEKHSLTGSWFDIDRTQKNNPFGNPLELSALDAERALPNRFLTADYNGIITNNFLIEALYARQIFKFIGSGADQRATPERGTNIYYPLLGAGGSFGGYPTFCTGCAPFPESRNNENYKLKGNYFLSSKALGTHNIAGGYENYKDMLKSDNYQSASDFTLWTYDTPTRDANGTLLHSLTAANGFLIWFPILESSHGNAFTTKSVFLNDKWDLNQYFNFNVGLRYDDNEGKNQTGAKVASDQKVSPRLGATYDVFANGRLRLNATYSQYVSKIANGNVGDVTSSAGSPAYLYWLYYGPDLVDLPRDEFLDQLFAWFNSVGGTKNTDFILGGGTPGISPQIEGKLKSPSVDEFTLGAGTQLGKNGFVRVDYQNRKWSDFYTLIANKGTGTVFDPLAAGSGADVDLKLITNSDDFSRKYNAFIVQSGYRLFNRLDLGGNYTYSKLRGNITGENTGGGPFVSTGSNYFPEFRNYPNVNPIGYLGADQRHKLRAWASIDFPTPAGTFNVSALQRFDSGTPYGANGTIPLVRGVLCATCPTNNPAAGGPGYTGFNINAFTTGGYWFSARDAYRTDDLSATDLALNYFLPLGRAQLFVEGKVFNLFNEQAVVNVNTTVRTSLSGSCRQTTGPDAGKACASFNPFTDTPVEGVNWIKGPSFGKPVNPTTGEPFGGVGDFQAPRTYRVSLGVRF